MSSDLTLIADLVRAGVSPDLIGRVAAALSGTVRDNVRDIVKGYERERKLVYRKKSKISSGKQTMSASTNASDCPGNVPDNSKRDHNVFLLSSSTETQRSKEKQESKRGTRLQIGTPLEKEYLDFAISLGFAPHEVPQMWAEFVDYWIGLPGHRGVKTNWLSTWRNRVRAIRDRRSQNGSKHRVAAAFDNLIARTGSEEVQDSFEPIDITPSRS